MQYHDLKVQFWLNQQVKRNFTLLQYFKQMSKIKEAETWIEVIQTLRSSYVTSTIIWL